MRFFIVLTCTLLAATSVTFSDSDVTYTTSQSEEEDSSEHLKRTPLLKKSELYQDLIKLTGENYTDSLDAVEKVWLIVFHEGFVDINIKREAVLLRGVIRFGSVNRLEEVELLRELKWKSKFHFRVYCHEPEWHFEDFKKFKDASQRAKSCAYSTMPEFKINSWEKFLETSYLSVPSRFPGVLILEPDTFSNANLALRSAALQMKNYFLFHTISNATNEMLTEMLNQFTQEQNLGIPGLFVVIADDNPNEKDDNMKFYAIRYEITAHGPINYPKILSFLVGINAEFRKTLPGENFLHDPDVVAAADVLHLERDFFNVTFSGEEVENNKADRSTKSNEHSKLNKDEL